jgi:hypothetical protein
MGYTVSTKGESDGLGDAEDTLTEDVDYYTPPPALPQVSKAYLQLHSYIGADDKWTAKAEVDGLGTEGGDTVADTDFYENVNAKPVSVLPTLQFLLIHDYADLV